MATNENLQTITLEASADLSAGQFRGVVVDANGQVALAGADTFVDGYLQDKPNAIGVSANIAIAGVTKVLVGTGDATAGLPATNAADGVTDASSTDIVCGVFLTGGVATETVSLLMTNMGSVLP